MSLDVYFRDDLARSLRSLSLLAAASLTSPAKVRGFTLTVRAIGESIGLNVALV